MITSPTFAGKRYGVLGLARSGAATVRALLASGAEVVAWDSSEAAVDALATELGDGSGRLMLADFTGWDDLARMAAIVVSPGVPLNRHPLKARADAAGVPVIGDIELFAQARAALPPHKVVGITGTNGKSTTTALIHHILEQAGHAARLGGNIGLPILGQQPLSPNDRGPGIYVLELSSYQIDITFSLDCDVAVLLNVTPDHLDRYDGFAGYAASKQRLFAMQAADHQAVIVVEDEVTQRTAVAERARRGGGRHVSMVRREDAIGQGGWPALQGPHNAQNAAAAIAACRALDVPEAAIGRGLATYSGLPHRMERVALIGGVLYVNDSKATNTTSVAPALAAYDDIHWILGGIAKVPELDACEPFYDRVKAAYTIGESGPMFAQLLAGKVPVDQCGTLEAAVAEAAAAARAGDVVMLSPACASFDQFRDYEHRGQAFRDAVAALDVDD